MSLHAEVKGFCRESSFGATPILEYHVCYYSWSGYHSYDTQAL